MTTVTNSKLAKLNDKNLLPADGFNMNNTNENPKRCILLLTEYPVNKEHIVKNTKIFTVCYSKTNWWKVNKWKPVQMCQEKLKKLKKNQILLSSLKTLNILPRLKNKSQKNNIMFKPTNKSKRNGEEGCFLCFYREPWTGHDSVEVSWAKRLKKIKMILKIICMMSVESD